jgi:predicted negative regulator of RcsB-dependent stress response
VRHDWLIIAWFMLGIWAIAIMCGWQAWEEHVANRLVATQLAIEKAEVAQAPQQGALGEPEPRPQSF